MIARTPGVGRVGDEGPVAARRVGKVEFARLVAGVEEEKERGARLSSIDEDGKRARLVGLPIDRFLGLSIGAQPADVGDAIARERFAVEKGVPPQDGEFTAQGEEPFHEFPQGDGLGGIVPWDPADLVVLAIAVVVAVLGAEPLVAGEQEGHTLRADEGGEEIPCLALPQGEDGGIIRDSLDAVIEGDVVRVAVGVLFSVGEVVFLVVADEVVQGEAVVRGDEIHAGGGSAAVVGEKVLAPRDAGGELARDARVAPPETAHAVAEFSVQLGPVDREIADLITAVAEIPGFGDELHP